MYTRFFTIQKIGVVADNLGNRFLAFIARRLIINFVTRHAAENGYFDFCIMNNGLNAVSHATARIGVDIN